METEFEHTIKLIRGNLEFCPWIKTQDTEKYAKNLFEEAEEVKEAIENKDYENLKEELGDVIWDAIMLAHLAEKEGHFEAKDILKGINEKITRRKPYIPKKEIVTIEDAHRIWAEEKSKEKSKENAK